MTITLLDQIRSVGFLKMMNIPSYFRPSDLAKKLDEKFGISPEKENRVYDVKVNGEDLDLQKTYTIASHSFILNGGDGYSMFVGQEIIKTSVGIDSEVLLDYIKRFYQ